MNKKKQFKGLFDNIFLELDFLQSKHAIYDAEENALINNSFYFLSDYSNTYKKILVKNPENLLTELLNYKINLDLESHKNNTNSYIIEKHVLTLEERFDNDELTNEMRSHFINSAIGYTQIIKDNENILGKKNILSKHDFKHYYKRKKYEVL